MTAQSLDFSVSDELRDRLHRLRAGSGVIGLLGLIAMIYGASVSPAQFFRSYLWAYILFVGISAGCLAWLMVQYLTGGAWGVVIRRPAEAAARTLPLLALLFVPVVIGIPNLYRWSHADVVAADAIIRHKHAYLN